MPALIALALAAAAPAPAIRHATGTFTVRVVPEGSQPAPPGGMPLGRFGIAKTFTGGFAGTAAGTMLAAGTPEPGHAAAYVALDQVTGTLDGRAGGFLLVHRGTVTSLGETRLVVEIAPESGTGALAGIAGTLAIEQQDGVHRYDLSYTLPAAR